MAYAHRKCFFFSSATCENFCRMTSDGHISRFRPHSLLYVMPGTKRKHAHEHFKHATLQEKEAWLDWFEQRRSEGHSVAEVEELIDSLPNSPSSRTLRLWRRQRRTSSLAPLPPSSGRPATLTEKEVNVVLGKVVRLVKKHKPADATSIGAFIQGAFGVAVSASWISRTLDAHGFSSHEVKRRAAKEVEPLYERTLHTFLLRARKEIAAVGDLSRVVFVDETSFWERSTIQRSYALRGGYVFTLFRQCLFSFLFDFPLIRLQGPTWHNNDAGTAQGSLNHWPCC